MKLITVDVSNLYYTIKHRFPGHKLSYEKYYRRCREICPVETYRAIAYGASMGRQADAFKRELKRLGFEIKYKEPKQFVNSRKADWDVGIAIDIVNSLKHIDSVVLGSADSDMVPVIDYLHEHNRRCHVFACGISSELKEVADSYHEICEQDLQ